MSENSSSCALCQGTGFRILELEEGRTRALPCDCRHQDREALLLDQARIPRRFQQCDLENFADTSTPLRLARQQVERFVREYPPEKNRGLLIMGPPGVGKTHLAVALLRWLIRHKGVPSLFYDFQDLLKEIQNSYNAVSGTSELSVLQPIFAAELLVLDDLGARKPTIWVAETLAHIISTRYNDVKTTIFTTNYLDSAPNKGDVTLVERIGERVRSRLYEMCQVVEIHESDFRVKVRQADFHRRSR